MPAKFAQNESRTGRRFDFLLLALLRRDRSTARMVRAAIVRTTSKPQPPPPHKHRPRQLTVERIYSAPSLSGQILRDTVWSPDGKWLTYLSRNGDPAGPQNFGPWIPPAASGRVLVDNDPSA